MADKINRFRGVYEYLSNFYDCKVSYEGVRYPTVENAYQAAKSELPNYRNYLTYCSPGQAKRMGQQTKLRDNWEDIKDDVMLELLRQKFSRPYFRKLLLETGDSELIEGNNWGDEYWGVVLSTGVGDNKLGKLLMQVRQELRNEENETT